MRAIRARCFPVVVYGLLLVLQIACVFPLFFFQAEDGIRDLTVTGVQTCALPISRFDWRVRRTVQRGLPPGAGTPARVYSAARKRQSKRALWATNTAASNARPKPATTSPKRGRPATMPSVMPVSRSTHRGIGVPGSSSASKARWMVPPSRMATATSRIRPPTWARTPVVSTSTTAKRACSRGSDAGLEVIPSERQGHAPGTAATAHQLAAVHRDHRPVAVVQPLLSRQQALGGHRFEPRMLELAQGRLVAGVGHGQAGPHREEIAGRGPLLALLEGDRKS